MDMILPCRSTISERFPVASFTVRVTGDRLYEVACATDPRLFHPHYATHRTPANFFTSRHDGLLHARNEESVFFIPPQQLQRFVGSPRIYYALGTYGGLHGESPRFTISPHALDAVPSISLGADFTGRSLERMPASRPQPASAAYGGRNGKTLRWGGDAVLDAEQAAEEEQARAQSTGQYDDGYDPSFWQNGQAPQDGSGDATNTRRGSSSKETSGAIVAPSALAWSESREESPVDNSSEPLGLDHDDADSQSESGRDVVESLAATTWGFDTLTVVTPYLAGVAATPLPGSVAPSGATAEFICRYLRNLTAAEVAAIHGRGLRVVSICEHQPSVARLAGESDADYARRHISTLRAFFTQAQGRSDATTAVRQARALGQPASAPIYFCIDYDDSSFYHGNFSNIDDYFGAVNAFMATQPPESRYPVGVYGGGGVLARCQSTGRATHFWQANARGWFNNRAPWAGANIRQFAEQPWAGVTNSANQALRVDFDVSDGGNEGSW